MHHLKADVERLYERRETGGGLMQLKMKFKTTTIGPHKYLSTTNDWMLHVVLFYDAEKKAHSISKQSNKFKEEFNPYSPNVTFLYPLKTSENRRFLTFSGGTEI